MTLAKLFAAAVAAFAVATPAFADAIVGLHLPEGEAPTLLIIGASLVGAAMRFRRRLDR